VWVEIAALLGAKQITLNNSAAEVNPMFSGAVFCDLLLRSNSSSFARLGAMRRDYACDETAMWGGQP
jgi:hypothetical protein